MQTQTQVSYFPHKRELTAKTGPTPGNSNSWAIFWNCKCGFCY